MLLQARTTGVRQVTELACKGLLPCVESLVSHKSPLHEELLAAVRAVKTRARALPLTVSFAMSAKVGLVTVHAETNLSTDNRRK